MSFRKVARIQDIPSDRGLCVTLDGIEVGVFRVGEDVFALENRCPHAGDPLSEGVLEGGVVICRAHGWDFDVRTGHRPDNPDGFPIPCFPVRVEDGEVEIDIEEPLNLPRRA